MMNRQRGLLAQVSAAHLVSHFHIMTLPALLPLLPVAVGVSFVDLGIALGIFNIVTALVQIPMGYAVDRLGARRLLLCGLALGSASFALVFLYPTFEVLVLAMVFAGIANGVYHPSDYALLSRGIHVERMGRAFSVHTFAGFLGGALAPFILISISSMFGIRWAFAVSSLIGLTAFVMIGLSGRNLCSDGVVARSLELKSNPIPHRPATTLAVMGLILFFMLLSLSTGAIEKFSVSALVQGFNVNLSTATSALTAFLFAEAFGVLAGGVLADRTRRHGMVAGIVFGVAALLIILVIVVPLPAVLLILTLAMAGFLSGSIAPSRDMLVRAAAQPGHEGRMFGIVSTGFNVGGVIGPILFGDFLDNGAASAVLWAAAGFMMMTTLIVLIQEAGMKRRLRPIG